MRILTVCGNLEMGGTQRAAQNFTLAYQRAGHAVAVLAEAGGLRAEVLRGHGVPVFLSDAGMDAAIAAVDAFGPELIHMHRPGIASAKDTALLRRLRRPERRVLETNVFARADYSDGADLIDVHLQLGAWCMWKWRTALGRDAARRAAAIVPYPVDVGEFRRAGPAAIAEFRARHRIPAGAYVCGRVGQPAMGKWHVSTAAAFDRVARRDAGAHLLLVGAPPEMRAAIGALPREVADRARFVAPIVDPVELAAAYSAIDCFLHAAHIGESFGMVLAEAMLCECPVVTASRPTRDNTQVELVGHEQGGLVAASTRYLPEAAERLWADRELRARLGAAARPRIESRFEADDVARRAAHIGELALRAPDRQTLIETLAADARVRTDCSDEEIRALLANAIGRPGAGALATKYFVHRPIIQRMRQRYNRWRFGW
jgi:glycosyltransferase involved in cell wall biosynthesis